MCQPFAVCCFCWHTAEDRFTVCPCLRTRQTFRHTAIRGFLVVDLGLYVKLVRCSTILYRNRTYLINQYNIHGTISIHSPHCSGFDDFLCVVSLDPIKPYKYLFLIHMLLPMTMLSLNDQNHINGLMEPFSLHDGISIVVFFSKLYFHYSFYEPCIC